MINRKIFCKSGPWSLGLLLPDVHANFVQIFRVLILTIALYDRITASCVVYTAECHIREVQNPVMNFNSRFPMTAEPGAYGMV